MVVYPYRQEADTHSDGTLNDMDNWTSETQARTKATATRHGDEWTSSDLELVTLFATTVSNEELAEACGRTLFAISSVKAAIRAGKRVGGGGRMAASDRPYRGWTEAMGDG